MNTRDFPLLKDVTALLMDPVGARLTAYDEDGTTVVLTNLNFVPRHRDSLSSR